MKWSGILALLLLIPATALAWTGQVTKITDGDTFDVMRNGEEVTVRLYGIDCPEHDQPYGSEAETFLRERIGGERVQVKEVTIGHYGRIIGLVEGGSVNAELVRRGLGWVFDRYCDQPRCERWKELEARAREREVGLWSREDPIPPWEWR